MLELLGNTVLGRGEGRKVAVGGDVYTILATGAQTGGRFAAFAFFVPPGGGPPPHTHTREDEFFYVTEGELTLDIAGTPAVLRAGDFAHAVRGVRHFFRNTGDVPARALVLASPAGFEEFLLEVGRPAAGDADAAPPTAAEIETLLAAAPKYGIEISPLP